MSDSQPPADLELDALRTTYPAWHIHRAAFGGYQAEWKSESGLAIRYVAAVSIADMHRRLEVIEAARGDNDNRDNG